MPEQCIFLQFDLNDRFLVTMFYVVDNRCGTAKYAWLSSQTETYATDDGRLSCAIRTNNDVQMWTRKELHIRVGSEMQRNKEKH